MPEVRLFASATIRPAEMIGSCNFRVHFATCQQKSRASACKHTMSKQKGLMQQESPAVLPEGDRMQLYTLEERTENLDF